MRVLFKVLKNVLCCMRNSSRAFVFAFWWYRRREAIERATRKKIQQRRNSTIFIGWRSSCVSEKPKYPEEKWEEEETHKCFILLRFKLFFLQMRMWKKLASSCKTCHTSDKIYFSPSRKSTTLWAGFWIQFFCAMKCVLLKHLKNWKYTFILFGPDASMVLLWRFFNIRKLI